MYLLKALYLSSTQPLSCDLLPDPCLLQVQALSAPSGPLYTRSRSAPAACPVRPTVHPFTLCSSCLPCQAHCTPVHALLQLPALSGPLYTRSRSAPAACPVRPTVHLFTLCSSCLPCQAHCTPVHALLQLPALSGPLYTCSRSAPATFPVRPTVHLFTLCSSYLPCQAHCTPVLALLPLCNDSKWSLCSSVMSHTAKKLKVKKYRIQAINSLFFLVR